MVLNGQTGRQLQVNPHTPAARVPCASSKRTAAPCCPTNLGVFSPTAQEFLQVPKGCVAGTGSLLAALGRGCCC